MKRLLLLVLTKLFAESVLKSMHKSNFRFSGNSNQV